MVLIKNESPFIDVYHLVAQLAISVNQINVIIVQYFDSNKSLAKRKYYTQTRVNYTLDVFFRLHINQRHGV